MPSAEHTPEHESREPEAAQEQETFHTETEKASSGAASSEPGGASEPADQTSSLAVTSAPRESDADLAPVAPMTEEPELARPLGRREILERESGFILWLTLAIGAGGLLLTLLLPWVHVYYPNATQAVQRVEFGSVIEFGKDEVVNLSVRGVELLTHNFWPLLGLFLLAALLLGSVIYWRQTHFAQSRIAWLVLALGLIVGLGFPIELGQLMGNNQRVEWSNDQATIEANQGIRSFDPNAAQLYLCPPDQQTCNSHYVKNSEGLITSILSAGVDWKQTAQGRTLVQGHADSTRASATSANVTTSGYAIGSFGNMGTSFGYWGAWLLSLWILLNTLILLGRLWRARR